MVSLMQANHAINLVIRNLKQCIKLSIKAAAMTLFYYAGYVPKKYLQAG